MVSWSAERHAVLEAASAEIASAHPAGRVVAGVDGTDTAGKTTFADDLAQLMRSNGVEVFRASIDDFHHPREKRYAQGRTSAVGYYQDAFDCPLFRQKLAEPFRRGDRFLLAGFDLDEDRPIEPHPVTAPADAILVVDGVFLQRPELRDLWDFVVYLVVDPAERNRRYIERDGIDPSSELAGRYDGAQALYLAESAPRASATVVLDNTDPDLPHRLDVG